MIHLAISDSHLLCAQWTEKDGQPLLTSFSYKKLPRPLSVLNNSETEIISVLNAGLHLIREDVPFEGDKVYVTIPDEYCHSSVVDLEPELTENDGWAFVQWTINQRWESGGSFEYFGRSFKGKPNSVFAIRVSTIFTEPIKLAIQELGGEAVWMGSESSVYFGLNPENGCTVFHPSANGYQYFQYSQDSFQIGSARFLKGEWKLHPLVGNDSDKKVFSGQLFFAGILTEKRKANFKGRRIKQMAALTGIALEGNIIPKGVKEEDLYILTAIATGTIKGVALNFFDKPGLQRFEYEKPVPILKSKEETEKPAKKKVVKQKVKKRIKKPKKKINFLQPFLYFFFFVTIGAMLVFDQKPELFDPVMKYKDEIFQKTALPIPVVTKIPIIKTITAPPKKELEYLFKSQSLISITRKILKLSDDYKILLLSISDGRMDLELVGTKVMDAPIDSFGDVLNYSLRQVNGDEKYKHGYLVSYRSADSTNIRSEFTAEEFQSYISGIDQSFLKAIDPIERNSGIQIPIIVRIGGIKNINQLLSELSVNGKNVVVEKFVYTSDPGNINPSAIFYISLYFASQTEYQD
ncbi:MAG: hypothetical protein HOA15_04720 [Candidatus Marinimicrobia bacterium]|nr:hypothetical protein [Candidatus Neomarinimicrobiota bacterium]MBT3675883.1 hypothetical protein [Candidatus Neomarinimicrobiota bacterium]MBT3763468.1 hypothetical protein [Candidatus Neomarinimicrobiota bacterium]MBT4068556.1 hypothetical protein [Candidatus Neomarinimicrobiota bacterium]MBT4271578.1 hypothetical protein [Candidatus Neomarinimicrobiota bacterium]